MDEGLDSGTDVGAVSDVSASESADMGIEPLADIPIEDVADSLNEAEPPISEQELTELQGEADALEIEPLDEGVDLGYDYDEAIQAANEAVEQPPETSAMSNILTSGAEGFTSPSDLAQIGGDIISPPGAEDAVTRGLQAGWNMGVKGSEEFMAAAHRQHAHDYERPSFPREGVDFIRNENGEPEPIGQMVQTTDENGEKIWIRS